MPRTKHLNVDSISGAIRNITALHIPVDGSDITLCEIALVSIRNEYGRCRIFPDGRPFWGTQGMRRASAVIVELNLGASSGEYHVFATDVLSGLPLNVHLMHRPPGIYGDALVLGWSGGSFVDIPEDVLRPDILREALDQIVAG